MPVRPTRLVSLGHVGRQAGRVKVPLALQMADVKEQENPGKHAIVTLAWVASVKTV